MSKRYAHVRTMQRSPWYRSYRTSIKEGKQRCRNCNKQSTKLTFDHIIPRTLGGSSYLENITILCMHCQAKKGSSIWPHLMSLRQEEKGIDAGMCGKYRARMQIGHEDEVITPECSKWCGVRSCMGRSQMRKSRPAHRKSNPFNVEALNKEISVDTPKPTLPVVPTPPSAGYQALMITPDQWREIKNRLEDLEQRVGYLEGAQPVSKDEATSKILDFLKENAGIKFNTGTIAGNLGLATARVSDRLRVLAERSAIRTHKLEGQSTMFWIEKEQNSE